VPWGGFPSESLRKGSVAIYSNSGNFSTTISEYLKTAGFGTSTILSSGKDVYIHFALAEFLYCAENDPAPRRSSCTWNRGDITRSRHLTGSRRVASS